MEAREAVDKAARVEAERDATRHKVVMVRLETDLASSARAQMESKLTRVQRAFTTLEGARVKAESPLDFVHQALAAVKEVCQKVKEEIFQLTDERLSLIMEVGAGKEELAAFQEKATTEREAMEADFNASSDVIFNYGYGCCAFTHDICGSKPMIPAEPLPPKFFFKSPMPPKCFLRPSECHYC